MGTAAIGKGGLRQQLKSYGGRIAWTPSPCDEAAGVLQVARRGRVHPTIAASAAPAAAGAPAGDQVWKCMEVVHEARTNMSEYFARRHTVAKPCAPDRVKGGGKPRALYCGVVSRGSSGRGGGRVQSATVLIAKGNAPAWQYVARHG